MKNIRTKEKYTRDTLIPKELAEHIENLKLTRIQTRKAYKLIDLLLRKSMTRKKNLTTFLPLPKNYIRDVFADGRYALWLNPLKEAGIVQPRTYVNKEGKIVEAYEKGVSSKLYRINPYLLSDNWVSIYFEDDVSDSIIIDSENYNKSLLQMIYAIS